MTYLTPDHAKAPACAVKPAYVKQTESEGVGDDEMRDELVDFYAEFGVKASLIRRLVAVLRKPFNGSETLEDLLTAVAGS